MDRIRITTGLFIAMIVLAGVPVGLAETPASEPFQRTWARTDQPVQAGETSRTWMWGPEGFTGGMTEPYAEAPDGERTVQYFDKARMEDNAWRNDTPPWDVTNGLLVVELITGRVQTGDDTFEDRTPAAVNVAGDSDDPTGPTYASFGGVLEAAPLTIDAAITGRIDRSGTVSDDPDLSGHGVVVAVVDDVTNHAIAAPFWEFMGSEGVIYQDGQYEVDALFENRYFATGRPVTEPYWANVKVANTYRDVLIQCFERRCLTYTPDNPEGWQVEAGNVGQHYYTWRYGAPGDVEGSTDTLAAELAGSLRSATTDDARYSVLVQIMDYLQIGVYTADGQVIVRGAEQAWTDFYVYDFELQMLAGALGRGQQMSIADIAVALEELGWVDEDESIDPNVVAQSVQLGIVAALEDQDALESRAALLLYELGLRHVLPVDLSQPVTWQDVRLDVLQHFLLLAELSISAVEDQLPVEAGATSNVIELSGGILKPATGHQLAGNVCTLPAEQAKDAHGWSKIFLELGLKVPLEVAAASFSLDMVHGALLSSGVRVQELEQRVESHYGHGGPGNPAQFQVKVEMLHNLPQLVVDCGWVVGATLPPPGPIEGVSISWMWNGLEEHGNIECGASCINAGIAGLAIDATNAEGIATLTFTPREEVPYPCENCWEVEETGIVTGVGLYQSRFTNLIGSNLQWVAPKSAASRWFVRWHQEPGYHVTMTKSWNDTWVSEGANDTTTSTGEVTIEFLVTRITPADPEHEWSTPLTVLDWSARGNGTRVHLDGDSDAEGETFGDWSCTFTWSDEWSGRSPARARRGENNEWILYDFWFDGSPVAEAGNGDERSSCAEGEASWAGINDGLEEFELPLVDGSFSFTEEGYPEFTWTIDVELIGPMPTSE